MKQVLLNPDGTIVLENVPAPILSGKGVIVQTEFSAISPGTEIANIKSAEEKIISKLYRRKKLISAARGNLVTTNLSSLEV